MYQNLKNPHKQLSFDQKQVQFLDGKENLANNFHKPLVTPRNLVVIDLSQKK